MLSLNLPLEGISSFSFSAPAEFSQLALQPMQVASPSYMYRLEGHLPSIPGSDKSIAPPPVPPRSQRPSLGVSQHPTLTQDELQDCWRYLYLPSEEREKEFHIHLLPAWASRSRSGSPNRKQALDLEKCKIEIRARLGTRSAGSPIRADYSVSPATGSSGQTPGSVFTSESSQSPAANPNYAYATGEATQVRKEGNSPDSQSDSPTTPSPPGTQSNQSPESLAGTERDGRPPGERRSTKQYLKEKKRQLNTQAAKSAVRPASGGSTPASSQGTTPVNRSPDDNNGGKGLESNGAKARSQPPSPPEVSPTGARGTSLLPSLDAEIVSSEGNSQSPDRTSFDRLYPQPTILSFKDDTKRNSPPQPQPHQQVMHPTGVTQLPGGPPPVAPGGLPRTSSGRRTSGSSRNSPVNPQPSAFTSDELEHLRAVLHTIRQRMDSTQMSGKDFALCLMLEEVLVHRIVEASSSMIAASTPTGQP
jgi:hypothetical protein